LSKEKLLQNAVIIILNFPALKYEEDMS